MNLPEVPELPRKLKGRSEVGEVVARHTLLSLVYGHLLYLSGEENNRVSAVFGIPGGIPVIALSPLNGESGSICYVIPVLDSDSDGFIGACKDLLAEMPVPQGEVEAAAMIRIGNKYGTNPTSSMYLADERSLVVQHVSGKEAEFAESGQVQPNLVPFYPHPYYEGIDPLIMLDFLNVARLTGPGNSASRIVNDATDLAMRLSIGQEPNKIRSEFNTLVRILSRIGMIEASGGRISSNLSSSSFRNRFHYRYNQYLERIGKKTLLDFGSLF